MPQRHTFARIVLLVAIFVVLTVLAFAQSPGQPSLLQRPLPLPQASTAGLIGIKARPADAPNQGSVNPLCPAPHLTYFGAGTVIPNVQIIPVFWGNYVDPDVVANMPQFYADLTGSNWYDTLSEYATIGTAPPFSIGRGTAVAGITIQPTRCNTSSACAVVRDTTHDDILNEVSFQMGQGNLPAGSPSAVYVVHLPPNVSVNGELGGPCPYHEYNQFTFNSLKLVVIPDPSAAQCSSIGAGNQTNLENETSAASLELAGMVTDYANNTPQGVNNGVAWYDNPCGEIGDICVTQDPGFPLSVDGRNWTVQRLWSNTLNACVGVGLQPNFIFSAGPSTIVADTPFSFTLTAQNPAGDKGTDTAYVGTVHFTSTDSTAVLPADFTFTPDNQGTSNFSATFLTAGTQTITATDTVNGDIVGTGSVTVTPSTLTPQTITFTTNAPASASFGSSFTIAATASSGLPVVFTSFGPCTNIGPVYTIGSGSGTCSVIANQSGNAYYQQAPQITETTTAVLASTSTTLSASTPFIVSGQSDTLTATVSSPVSGAPTGTVAFMAGTTSIASVPLTATGPSTATASITIGTSQLNFGSNSFTAVYSGDMNYATSTSSAVAVSLLQSNFGTGSVGTSSSQLIEVQLPSGGTVGAIQTVTQGIPNLDFTASSGGTCATGTAYTAGQICTVNVAFNPAAPGVRIGAVQLLDASSNVLGVSQIYGVGQGPAIAFSPGAPSKIGGLTNPTAAAADAAGNLYVADSGKIVRIPPGCNTASCQATVATGFTTQINAIAIDGAGDLFITGDPSAGTALFELPYGCSSSSCTITVPVPAFGHPNGIALDKLGNLYFSDSTLPYIIEILNGCTGTTCTLTIGANLSNVTGVAVDGAGNVFISEAAASSGAAPVVEFPNGGGNPIPLGGSGLALNTDPTGNYAGDAGGVAVDAADDVIFSLTGSSAPTVQTFTGLLDQNNSKYADVLGSGPYGQVVLDSLGNAFVIVLGDGIYEFQRSQPQAMTFSSTNIGQTSSDSPRLIQIQNIGNQPLSAVAPGIAIGPGSDFTQIDKSTTFGDCTSTFSLTSNQGGSNICELFMSFTPTSDGSISSSLALTDNALGASSASQTIPLQGTGVATTTTTVAGPAPIVYGASASVTVTVTAAASDSVSGDVSLSVDGGASQTLPLTGGSATFTVSVLAAGTHTLSAAFAAQNNLLASSATGSLQVNPAPQLITFTTNAPASAAKTTSFTVAAASSSGLPVVFSSGGACTNSGATYTVTASTGTCSVIANQPGNANYLPAPTVTQLTTAVAPIATVVLTSSANPSTAGKSVSFTASVSGPGAAPTGKVEFLEGTTVVATKALSAGSASTSTKWLVPGNYTLTAVYMGDTNYPTASSAPLVQVVNTPTATAIVSSLNPSSYNQPVTFTATVTPAAGSVPDGETVTFLHGSVVVGTGVLNAGKASFTTSALSTGTTNVTASYAGDANYTGSSSSALKQVVNASPTATTLTSSVNPSKSKQAVVFTVTVTAPYNGIPNGSVTLYDGTTTLKTATLSNGTVSIQISNLTSGAHNLQATYKGNDNFTTSTSTVLVQTVN